MKPLVLQELLGSRPISRIKFHHLQNKFLVLLANLLRRREAKWSQAFSRATLHNPHNRLKSRAVRDIHIGRWKRAKTSMMLHEDFDLVILVIDRDIGFEDVKSFSV